MFARTSVHPAATPHAARRSKRRYLYLDDFKLEPVRRRRWVLLFAVSLTIPFVFFIYDHRESTDDLTAGTYIADYARIFGYCFVPMLVSHWRPVRKTRWRTLRQLKLT